MSSATGPPILVFPGKGGVGKTTVAASTVLACAEAGHRPIVLSTDAALLDAAPRIPVS